MTQKKKYTAANSDWHVVHIRVSNEAYQVLEDRAKLERRSCTKVAEFIVNDDLLKSKTT